MHLISDIIVLKMHELTEHLVVAVDVSTIYNICSTWSQQFLQPEEVQLWLKFR